MNSNDCGDTSNAGSHQTDWRLPNIRELLSLLDYGSITAMGGTTMGGDDNSFTLSGLPYWSSTSTAEPLQGGRFFYCIEPFGGTVQLCSGIATIGGISVIVVRGGLH